MSLRNAILGLLSQAPMTGFDLIREFDVAQSVIWPAPQNEVYRVLAGLAKDGLIAPAASGPRGARAYQITQAGRAALAEWLAAPSDYTLRYEPILKAAFLRDADPALRRARAEADLAFFSAQSMMLEAAQARRKLGDPDPRGDARAMAVGLYKALMAWAREVAAGAD